MGARVAFEVEAQPDVEFASDEGQTLLWDVYRPVGADGPLPVALVFHGGGWRRGDRSRVADAASGLAARGYLAIAVGYRLLSDEVDWPAPVHDVKTAVRTVRARASELSANPDQIALVGYSAGAHISLLAAASANSSEVFADGERPNADESESVHAVAAFFPPVTAEGIASMLALDEAAARQAAPLTYAAVGQLPPILLLHGTSDTRIPHAPNSLAMYEALQAAGTPADLRLLHGLPHEFVHLPGMTEATTNDVAAFLDRHMTNPDDFARALEDDASFRAARLSAEEAAR